MKEANKWVLLDGEFQDNVSLSLYLQHEISCLQYRVGVKKKYMEFMLCSCVLKLFQIDTKDDF